MRHKRNAFTLVELLLVVIAVVILSSMIMLAGGEAQSAAKATKIVNTLSELKMFAITWYNKNINKFDKNGNFHSTGKLSDSEKTLTEYFSSNDGKDEINNFITGNITIDYTSRGGYSILSNKDANGKITWYACHYLENNNPKELKSIKNKLKDKAQSAQNVLLQESSGTWKSYTNDDKIYIQILTLDY